MLGPPFHHPEGLYRDAKFREGFRHLGELGLTFDAWLLEPQLPEVIDLLNEDLRFTVLVGEVYRDNPSWAVHKMDSLNLAVARAHAADDPDKLARDTEIVRKALAGVARAHVDDDRVVVLGPDGQAAARGQRLVRAQQRLVAEKRILPPLRRVIGTLIQIEQDHVIAAGRRAAIAGGVDIAVSSPRQLDAVVDAAARRGEPATLTVKVDTGMNRSGVGWAEWEVFIEAFARAHAAGAVALRGVMAHLACSDEPDHPANDAQAAGLRAAVADLAAVGGVPELVHLANSPAALTRPDLAFDAVRPGVALYGLNPVPNHSDAPLIPAMTLRSEVSLVKRVAAGGGVSYGLTYVAPADTVVGIVPVGYADGVPRALSGKLRVRINGRDFPGIGRMCMDQFVVDLGPDGGGVTEGDEVELFGTGADDAPTAGEWAEMSDTIDYEIITGIGGRIARRYVGGQS